MIKCSDQDIAGAKALQSKSKLTVRISCGLAKLDRWLRWVLISGWRMPCFDVCSRCTVAVDINDIAVNCASKRSGTAEKTRDQAECASHLDLMAAGAR